jgi:AraC-like DNA-binding protein
MLKNIVPVMSRARLDIERHSLDSPAAPGPRKALIVPRRKGPVISLAAATGLLPAIEAAGGDADDVLGSLGLRRATLSSPDGFMLAADFAQILEQAARVTGDECFGLHFGERYHPKNVGPLIYVVLNSPTIAVCLENIARYLRVHNEAADVSFVLGPQWAYLRHLLADLPAESRRQHNEYSLAVGLATIRLMVGSDWAPVEVQFEHKPPGQTSEHVRVFGAPVSFGHDANAFVVEPEFCQRQIPAADARLYPILRRYLDRILDELPPEDGLLISVRRVIGDLMRQGEPKLGPVASKLAIGPRTLQRRLKEQGADFKALVDDTRRRFSLRYLQDRKNTLTEVAYLLGYSEVSAFNRAFKRWTGSAPSDYRRKLSSR